MDKYSTCDCAVCVADRLRRYREMSAIVKAAVENGGDPMPLCITNGQDGIGFVSGHRLPTPPGFTELPGQMGTGARHLQPALCVECPQCGRPALKFFRKDILRILCPHCGHKGVAPENDAFNAALDTCRQAILEDHLKDPED